MIWMTINVELGDHSSTWRGSWLGNNKQITVPGIIIRLQAKMFTSNQDRKKYLVSWLFSVTIVLRELCCGHHEVVARSFLRFWWGQLYDIQWQCNGITSSCHSDALWSGRLSKGSSRTRRPPSQHFIEKLSRNVKTFLVEALLCEDTALPSAYRRRRQCVDVASMMAAVLHSSEPSSVHWNVLCIVITTIVTRRARTIQKGAPVACSGPQKGIRKTWKNFSSARHYSLFPGGFNRTCRAS